MRSIKKEFKIYKFSELSDEVKEKVIQNNWYVNVDHDWWDSSYYDAERVNINIKEFDVGRASYCHIEFIEYAIDTAKLIIKEHGEKCETHKTANEFLESIKGMDNESEEYEYACEEFKRSISEDYRIILQKEYEYLTSETAIIDTIEANEYEFTEDGKLY